MTEHKTYLVFDKVTPQMRGLVSVLLIAVGFIFQITTRSILAGLPFIIACVILNLLKGLSIKRIHPDKFEWQEVTPVKINAVLAQCAKIKKFRSQDAGCFIFGIIIAIFFFSFGMPLLPLLRTVSFSLLAAVINAAILFGGLAFSGRRSAWMPRGLDIKAEIVQRMINQPLIKKEPGIQVMPYLRIGKTKKGSFPDDTRFLIRFKDITEDFIGLQGQISINSVKGRHYPYFYVVLIAKHRFGLFTKFGKQDFDKLVIEHKRANDVDVIVIRQKTTKTSGYHTNTKVQDYTLRVAIKSAKKMLGILK